MSVEAMGWVLQHACGVEDGQVVDVPKHLVAVLIGLANHARHDGTGSYPGKPLLAHYARKDVRAVHNDLAQLLELQVIRHGDQRLVEHIPADERPVVYDLVMDRQRPGRSRARNPTTCPDDPGPGSPLPPDAGQQVPSGHDRPEPQYRPEVGFRPEADDRKPTSDPERMEGKPTSGRESRDRKPTSGGGGSGLPPNRPSNRPSSSSSSATDPQSLVDRYSRSVAIIRQHLPDVDDETAAKLAAWVHTRHGPKPALLGAYVRRMALAGDLAGALAEMCAGEPSPAGDRPASSLIALWDRAGAAQRAAQAAARAVRGEQRRARYREASAAIRGPRPPDPGGGPDPPAAAAAS